MEVSFVIANIYIKLGLELRMLEEISIKIVDNKILCSIVWESACLEKSSIAL